MTDLTTADHGLIDPTALGELLQRSPYVPDGSTIKLTSFTAEPVGAGQMARSFRLYLDYEKAPPEAPQTVVVKVPSTDPASLAMAAGTGAYLREVLFYRELAGSVGASVPRCHQGSVSEDGTEFLLVLEDLAPAVSVDQRAGGSVDQVATVLHRIADVHGRFWGRADAAWLPVQHVWGALSGQIPAISEPWLARFARFLTSEQVSVIERLGAAAPSWLATLDDRRTVWHGDLRLDNLLFQARDATSDVVIVDWQSTASGPGVTDAAYLIGTTLEPQIRRTHERELVAAYHQQLTSHQATAGYTLDSCWLDYRAQALYALVLCVPVSMGVQPTERGDAMFGAMAARAADHVRELETFEALELLLR